METFAWCSICNVVSPIYREPMTTPDVTGHFVGGDIVCGECHFIIATVFKKQEE